MADREYKYSKALEVDTSFRGLASAVQNDVIRDVAKTYASNIERILSMGKIPLMLAVMVDNAEETSKFGIKTMQQYAEESYPPEPKCPAKPEPKRPAKQEHPHDAVERQRRNDEKEEDYQNDLRYYQNEVRYRQNHIDRIEQAKEWIKQVNKTIEARSKLYTYGLGPSDGVINQILGLTSETERADFARGLESTLNGMVIGAWTAFETLATDLWVVAVNMRPSTLGVAALASSMAKREDRSGGDDVAKVKPHSISLDILKKYNFNLFDSMGTMLWREEKAGFNSLESIINSYKGAFAIFHKDGLRADCPPKVKNWFNGEDFDNLRILEASRHVLVHRAGVVDAIFLDRVKEKHVGFSKLEVDDTIQMDGELVRDLISSSIRRGKILLQGVDEWLKPPE